MTAVIRLGAQEEKSDDFWTVNHLKLLYLISKYSHCAQTVHEKERWIRKLPMLVLLYEGIVQRGLEYDRAPAAEVVDGARVPERDAGGKDTWTTWWRASSSRVCVCPRRSTRA